MHLVLDASVAMRWLLPSEAALDQQYANAVLCSLLQQEVRVPSLWYLEVASVLLGAEKRGNIDVGASERFISQLQKLPIHVDGQTAEHAWSRTLTLARAYALSAYDAAYLELAVRESLPLATLDQALCKAAVKSGVLIYQPLRQANLP